MEKETAGTEEEREKEAAGQRKKNKDREQEGDGEIILGGVLVSAGTELTLFLVAGAVLWFGFSVSILLITH